MQLQVMKGVLLEKMKELLEWDLCMTVNSDDPPFFGGYVNENFRFWAKELGLTARQLHRLATNSVNAAFLDESVKSELRGRIERVWMDFSASP